MRREMHLGDLDIALKITEQLQRELDPMFLWIEKWLPCRVMEVPRIRNRGGGYCLAPYFWSVAGVVRSELQVSILPTRSAVGCEATEIYRQFYPHLRIRTGDNGFEYQSPPKVTGQKPKGKR